MPSRDLTLSKWTIASYSACLAAVGWVSAVMREVGRVCVLSTRIEPDATKQEAAASVLSSKPTETRAMGLEE